MYSPPVSRRIVGSNGAAATAVDDSSPHSIRRGQPILVQHGWLTANNTKPILIPEVAQHPPPMHHAVGGSGGGDHQMVAMSQFEREVAPSNQPGGGQQPAGVAAPKDRRVVGAKIVGRNSPELVWWSEALKRKEHIRLTQQQQQSGGHPITLLLHAQSSKIGREQLEVWCAKANKKQTTDVDGSKAYRVYVRCIGKRPTTIKRQSIEVTTSSRKKKKQQREQQEEVLHPGCSTEIRNGDVVQLAEDEAPFELQGGCCCEDVVTSSDAPSGARKRGAGEDTGVKASHSFGGSHHPPQGMEEIPISTLDGDSLDKMDAALQRLADAPPPSDDVQRMTRVHPEVAAKESDADDMALLLGAAAVPGERKGTPQRHPTLPAQAPTTSGQTTDAPQQPAVVAAVVEEDYDDMAILLKSGPPPPAVAATKPPTERQPTPAAGADEEVAVVGGTAAPPEALTTSTTRGKKSKNKKEAGSKRGRKSTAKQAQPQAPPPTEQVEGDDHSKKKKATSAPPNNKGSSSSFGVVVAADVEDQLPPTSNSSASKTKKKAPAPPPVCDTGDMSDIFVVSDDDVVGHGMEALSRSVTPQRKNDVASELPVVADAEEEEPRCVVVGDKKAANPSGDDALGKSNTEVELEAQVAAITAQISADVPPAAPPALLAAQPNKQHVSVSDDEEDESLLQFYKRKRLEEAQQEKSHATVKTVDATKNGAVPIVVENEEKKSCSTAKTASGKTKGKAPKAAKKSSASKSKKKTAQLTVTMASGSPAKKHVTVVTPLQQPSDPLQPSGSGTPPPPVARTLHMSQVTQDPPAEPIDENDVLDSSNLHDVVVAAVTEGEENGDQQVPESPQVATTGPPPPPSGGARPSFSAAPSSTSAARPRPSDGSDGDVENGGAATQTQQQSQQQRQQRNIVTARQQHHEAVIADVEEDEVEGESQSIVELQRSVVVMSQQFPPQEEESSAVVEAEEEEDDSAESQDSLVKGLVGGSHQKKPQQRVAEPSKTKTNTASGKEGKEANQQDTLESTQLARSTSKQTTTTTSKAQTQQQVGRTETPTTSKADRAVSGASSARSSVSMQNKESQYFMLNGDRIHIPAAMSTGKKAPKQKSVSQRESQLDGKGSTSARSPVPPNHRVDSQYTSLDALMAMIDSQNSQGGVEQDTALLGVALAKHHADNTNNSMLPQRSATMPPVTLTNHMSGATHGAFLSSANPPSVPLSGNGPSAGSGPPLKNYAMMPPLSTATGGSNGSGALPLSRRQTSGSHGARYGFLNNNAQQQQQRGAPAASTSAAAMVDSQVVFFDHGDDF